MARHWGLDDSVLHMIRRIPPAAPVRTPESDADILRASASCANDLVDAMAQPAARAAKALGQVAQRYARPLGLTAREMQEALQSDGIAPVRKTPAAAAPAPAPDAVAKANPAAGPWAGAMAGTLS